MKKLFSHILPFGLKKYTSKISGVLEINYVDGKKVLDTANSNYSYGSLQKILHRGLDEIKFNNSIENILVLGLGGGSIVETIREDFRSNAFIELVDIDPEIISIAKTEFEIERFKNLNLVCDDAASYVKTTNKKFDLIIVDIFIISTIPEQFTQEDFLNDLISRLNPKGKLIYNTMRDTMPKETLTKIKTTFSEKGLTVKTLEKIEGSNNLIIVEK